MSRRNNLFGENFYHFEIENSSLGWAPNALPMELPHYEIRLYFRLQKNNLENKFFFLKILDVPKMLTWSTVTIFLYFYSFIFFSDWKVVMEEWFTAFFSNHFRKPETIYFFAVMPDVRTECKEKYINVVWLLTSFGIQNQFVDFLMSRIITHTLKIKNHYPHPKKKKKKIITHTLKI